MAKRIVQLSISPKPRNQGSYHQEMTSSQSSTQERTAANAFVLEDGFPKKGIGRNEVHSLPIMKGSVKHVPTKRFRFKVVVRKVERPFNDDFEHQLAWICSSLGFFEPIDKDKNAAAVFKEIVLATEKGEALSSTAIAERIGMSRGAVINHLNNLLRSGLVEKSGRFYSARSRSMKRTIEEIEDDVDRIFSQLKRAAEGIDEQIGFEE